MVVPDVFGPWVPALVHAVQAEAPGVTLRLLPLAGDLRAALDGERPAVAFCPTSFVPETFRARTLGRLRIMVAGRADHPALRRRLTVERWVAYPHIVVRLNNPAKNPIDRALEQAQVTRRVGLEVPSYVVGLMALTQSDHLMNVPVPVARAAVRQLGLRLSKPPLEIPHVAFALVWHPRFDRDPAHAWFRRLMQAEARRALARAPGAKQLPGS